MYISRSALHSYQQKLDTGAQNVANANTVGYKKRDAVFSENLATEIKNQFEDEKEIGRLTPNGIRTGFGVHLGQTAINMQQGNVQETDNPFDFMIEGRGFFQVSHPSGPDKDGPSEIRYTRDGSFKLTPSFWGDTNYLVNSQGDYLLDDFGDRIEVPTGYDVKISGNGEIYFYNQNNPDDFYTNYTQIGVVDIANPQLLQNVGGNQYVLREDLLGQGVTVNDLVQTMDLSAEGSPKIRQGALETSNVDLAKEMTEMMIAQKGFQLNSRAISYADQMMGIANGIFRG
nr:flagellar hook-basal body protein [Ammoniphilus resinae]